MLLPGIKILKEVSFQLLVMHSDRAVCRIRKIPLRIKSLIKHELMPLGIRAFGQFPMMMVNNGSRDMRRFYSFKEARISLKKSAFISWKRHPVEYKIVFATRLPDGHRHGLIPRARDTNIVQLTNLFEEGSSNRPSVPHLSMALPLVTEGIPPPFIHTAKRHQGLISWEF